MSFRFYHTVFSAAAQEPFFRSVRGRKGFSMKVNPLLLVEYARAARANAYCPYSGFAVGAALMASSGEVYCGVNCESASYGATVCAERAALCAAVTAGETSFLALAVAAGDAPVTPCGVCRQMLAEFGDMPVFCAAAEGDDIRQTTLSALLPDAFTRGAL
jgi:cytidine deaminase